MSQSFRIGDVTVERIVECEVPFDPVRTFLPGITDEQLAENRQWMQPNALDAQDWLILCFQSYVIRTPHSTILLDSCIGNDKDRPGSPVMHRRSGTAWLDGLAALGLGVGDIDVVMCTHLHADHVGWNTRLQDGRWVPTFPNAEYLFADKEVAYWQARNAASPVPAFADSVLPIMQANRHRLVSSSLALDDTVRLLPTPGHTPDHFAVAVGERRDDVVFTGDLIHSPIQMRYPELGMRSDVEPDQANRTRRSFLERYCDTDTICCTAHFPSPSRVRVKRWGDGFRCDPVV